MAVSRSATVVALASLLPFVSWFTSLVFTMIALTSIVSSNSRNPFFIPVVLSGLAVLGLILWQTRRRDG